MHVCSVDVPCRVLSCGPSSSYAHNVTDLPYTHLSVVNLGMQACLRPRSPFSTFKLGEISGCYFERRCFYRADFCAFLAADFSRLRRDPEFQIRVCLRRLAGVGDQNKVSEGYQKKFESDQMTILKIIDPGTASQGCSGLSRLQRPLRQLLTWTKR